ncbi:phage tail protein [Microbulbifer sp. 2201CG32-9]|uniref:phage tail protein n=1 Tax=Microbulbifer sp. 2201CG32-9 TaxID=3232309 RepID=UPI00345BCC6B
MMMSLGLFAFSLSSAAYRDLQRQTAWRHAGSDRIGARAATQFLGPGNDTITLSGLIAPDLTGDPASLNTLRDMADRGQAWTLVDGNGNVHGAWVIESLQESRSLFFADGSARRIEFKLQLKQVDRL